MVFYVVFLGVLFGLFFGLLAAIRSILMKNKTGPIFGKTDLMSDPSPALAIFPRLPITAAPIVWYTRRGIPSEYMIHPSFYVEQINKLLKPYRHTESKRYVNCENALPREGQYCLFSKTDLGACGDTEADYGYRNDAPCVFLKLNMIENWKPSRRRRKTYMFKAADDEKLMLMANDTSVLYLHNGTNIMYPFEMVGIHCEGITSFDDQHMGQMSYYPWNGFKEYFFPYDGSEDYLRPLVGLQFKNITRGLVIGVKCTIQDIENMKNPLLHSAIFYLYIDRT